MMDGIGAGGVSGRARTSRRIDDIEMLRAVAVIFVLICHARGSLIPWKVPVWEHITSYYFNFWPGVDLFFAISGFVIARSLLPRLAESAGQEAFLRTALAFWVRRAWRLLPSAWLWLAVILVACVFFNRSGAFETFHTNFESVIAALLSVANFRLAWAFPYYPYGPSSPYWSLSLEEQFYLALPVLAYLSGRRLAVVLTAGLVIMAFLPETSLLMNCRVQAILLGVLLALSSRGVAYRLFEPVGLRRVRFPGPLILAFLVLLLASLAPLGEHITASRVDLIALISAVLVWIASYDRDYLWPAGACKQVMLWVGSRSYALYLIHFPVYCATREIWFRLSPPGTVFGPRYTFAFLGVGLPLLFGLAELNYRFVEKPFRVRGARIADRLARDPAGFAAAPGD